MEELLRSSEATIADNGCKGFKLSVRGHVSQLQCKLHKGNRATMTWWLDSQDIFYETVAVRAWFEQTCFVFSCSCARTCHLYWHNKLPVWNLNRCFSTSTLSLFVESCKSCNTTSTSPFWGFTTLTSNFANTTLFINSITFQYVATANYRYTALNISTLHQFNWIRLTLQNWIRPAPDLNPCMIVENYI